VPKIDEIAKKKVLITILLTVITAVSVQYVRSVEPLTNERLYEFPLTIGEWRGRDIPMEDWVYQSLNTDYAILRDYHMPQGNTVNLAVVWYEDKEVAFHAVESCLGGVGNKVKDKSIYSVTLPRGTLEVERLLVNRDNQEYLVFYFYVSSGYSSPSQTQVRKHILLQRLMMKRASAALVRMMMPINVDAQSSLAVLENFVEEVYPVLIDYTDHTSRL